MLVRQGKGQQLRASLTAVVPGRLLLPVSGSRTQRLWRGVCEYLLGDVCCLGAAEIIEGASRASWPAAR